MLEMVIDNSQQSGSVNCREQVEKEMREMIARLHTAGLPLAEIALSLADAADEYVMSLAKKSRRAH